MRELRTEILCAWTGPMTVLIFSVAWLCFLQWLPPPPPSLSAADVAALYQGHATEIRIGMMLIMFGGALNTVFAAVLMVYMLKMQGVTPALAYAQFGSSVLNTLLYFMPAQMWTTTAFRPERAAEITQYGNDLGWLTFAMVNSTTIVMVATLGVAVLSDRGEQPIFPRWFGYFNLWIAQLVVPAGFITFFKTGIFSWAGVLGFYLGVVALFVWYFVTFVLLRTAILRSDRAFSLEVRNDVSGAPAH